MDGFLLAVSTGFTGDGSQDKYQQEGQESPVFNVEERSMEGRHTGFGIYSS